MGNRGYTHKQEVDPKKNTLFIEQHIEDVKQDQKTVPDLLESTMRPTDPVKEEFGGWGEASLEGQSPPTGRSFRPVRACVRAVLFMSNQG